MKKKLDWRVRLSPEGSRDLLQTEDLIQRIWIWWFHLCCKQRWWKRGKRTPSTWAGAPGQGGTLNKDDRGHPLWRPGSGRYLPGSCLWHPRTEVSGPGQSHYCTMLPWRGEKRWNWVLGGESGKNGISSLWAEAPPSVGGGTDVTPLPSLQLILLFASWSSFPLTYIHCL